MARKRKTVSVEALRAKINARLADETTGSAPRMALASLLESVLMDSGNYRGFNYLGWLNGGCSAWEAAGEPEDKTPFIGDETRRVYF